MVMLYLTYLEGMAKAALQEVVMPPEIVVYLDDTKDMVSDGWGPEMMFRLVYFGPVRPHKPGMDMLRHKQRIRNAFHRQLEQLWSTNEILTHSMTTSDEFHSLSKPPIERVSDVFYVSSDTHKARTLLDVLLECYSDKCTNNNGYRWAPLVLQTYSLSCELDILMMFRGHKPGPIEYGDLDSRVKTIIDALKQPEPQNIVDAPREPSRPYFVLLQDDKLVSRLTVETDTLYLPWKRKMRTLEPNDRLVNVVVTVTLKPYRADIFNLMFGNYILDICRSRKDIGADRTADTNALCCGGAS